MRTPKPPPPAAVGVRSLRVVGENLTCSAPALQVCEDLRQYVAAVQYTATIEDTRLLYTLLATVMFGVSVDNHVADGR